MCALAAFQSFLTIIIPTPHTCSELNQCTYWDNYLWIFHPSGHCIHHDDMCVIFFLCPRAIRVKSKQAWRQSKPTEIDVIMKRNWSIRYWCLIRTLKSSNLWNQRRIREVRASSTVLPSWESQREFTNMMMIWIKRIPITWRAASKNNKSGLE